MRIKKKGSQLKAFVTGGSGRVMTAIRVGLGEVFDKVVLFSNEEPAELHAWETSIVGDLADAAAVSAGMVGSDVVLHFGAKADEAPAEEILHSNVLGTTNVFEAARALGVRRIVFASSHHVSGFRLLTEYSSPSAAPLPDSMYGVSKAYGEALGALYSHKWGLEVVALRIGVCREQPENQDQLYTWLSQRDCLNIVRRAVVAELSTPFLVLYAFSNNGRSFWSREGWRDLNYVPTDSADAFAHSFEEDVFRHSYQGGAFTDPDYRGGIWS